MLSIISVMQDVFGMDASNFEKQYKVMHPPTDIIHMYWYDTVLYLFFLLQFINFFMLSVNN
jgi:hypothetical protein